MTSKGYLRALEILRDNPDIGLPSRFAELMWPDAPGWEKSIKVGRGATRGAGMPRAGGHLLGRMRKAGLIDWYYPDTRWSLRVFFLTKAGKEFLLTGVEKLRQCYLHATGQLCADIETGDHEVLLQGGP